MDQRQQHARERRMPTARKVRKHIPRRERGLAFRAQHVQHARHGEVVDIVARHLRVLAITAKSRQSHDDQSWVALQQHGLWVKAEFLEYTRPEGVDEYVGRGDEGEE